MSRRAPGAILARLTLTAAFWGGAFVAGKIALASLGPLTVAFWRFAIGAAVLAPVWAAREGRGAAPRSARAWGGLAALGVLGVFGYNWFFFRGLALVEPGAAALVITTNPALTALVSSLLLRERLSPLRLAGFALAASGALVVLSGGNWEALAHLRLGPGAGLLGLAVVAWVFYTVLGKVVMGGVSPLTASAGSFLVGLPLLAAAAWREGPLSALFAAPAAAWAALGFMGVFSSALAFLWFYEGVAALGAGRASVFIYLVPGFALAISHALLGEPVTVPKVAGGALVVVGVVLTSLRGRKRSGARAQRAAG
ncbi:MAG: DMT family transporter [Deltaproteobacteria bacterium]|nr:DMT family transporter [Deltaproteobacteria bacterium]